MPTTQTAIEILDRHFLEIRHRLLDIAAGLDRIDRADDAAQISADRRYDQLKQAIALKPDSADYYNNYGLALASSGKGAEAQEALNKAAQLDPPNAGRYFFNLGAVQVNAGRGKEATEAFRKAIAADPNYAEAWYQLGISLLSDAKVDPSSGKTIPAAGTAEAFQKYLELQPAGPNAENAKGMIATLGGTVQTSIKAEKGAKKR